MNQDAKKTALRMIPYGIYVLTADDGQGNVAAATVNWVTQTAFNPPLVVVGVKTDSGAYSIVKNTKSFVLNMLGKEHKGMAFTFFKPAQLEGGKLSGQAIHKAGKRRADPRRRFGRGRMQGDKHRRAGRPPYRRRRGHRGAPAEADRGPPGCRDPRNEGPRRQRLLRRLRRNPRLGCSALLAASAAKEQREI